MAPSDKSPEGTVGYLVFSNQDMEALGVLKLVRFLIIKGEIPLEEILILVRTRNIGKLIKNKLKENNILYSDPEESLALLKNNKTRELLNILRLIVNKNDSISWWTILHITRGIGITTINEINELAHKNNLTFGEILINESDNGFKNIKLCNNKLEVCIKMTLEIIKNIEVPDKARWGDWIMEQIKNKKLPSLPKGMEELFKKIDYFKEASGEISLQQYVNQIEPVVKDIMNSKINNHVRIMTLNKSKGLTVCATIIAGVEEGIIPFPRGDYQEERRLLYVGMSRASNYLFLTRCQRRIGPTARSGHPNVAGIRNPCPFLNGGPVTQKNGDAYLKQLGL